jgi:hypothetical protein
MGHLGLLARQHRYTPAVAHGRFRRYSAGVNPVRRLNVFDSWLCEVSLRGIALVPAVKIVAEVGKLLGRTPVGRAECVRGAEPHEKRCVFALDKPPARVKIGA